MSETPTVDQRQPADTIQGFAAEEHRGSRQQHWNGAHHQRGVADGGQGESVKLKQKLDGDAQGRGDQQRAHLSACEMKPAEVDQHHRQHAQGSEQKAIKHHVLHAHLVHCDPAEVKPGAPQASGEGAGAVA